MKVAFIGLGIMGSRMAKNLCTNDIDLTVYNRSAAAVVELQKKGAVVASSPHQAVQKADIVFTMLSSPDVVKKLAWPPDGFVSTMQSQALWIDCSTVNPSFSRQCSQLAVEHNIRFMDAPVAGTKLPAEKGELLFLCGGAKEDLDQVDALLKIMGSRVLHIGDTGMGTSFKMIVNSMLALSMLTFSESVLLGEKLGLDKNFLLDTLPGLAVCAPFIKAKAPVIREGIYDVQFPLELMHKDLSLVLQSADEKKQPVYFADLAKKVFLAAQEQGFGKKDFSAIFEFLDKTE